MVKPSIKPYDFFKTRRKDYPVKMFSDNDRDGVANVFDCKPNNPRQQGIIDAIVGGVKGLVSGTGAKKGFVEGWRKPRPSYTREVSVDRPYLEKQNGKIVLVKPSSPDYYRRKGLSDPQIYLRQRERRLLEEKQKSYQRNLQTGKIMTQGGKPLTKEEFNKMIAAEVAKQAPPSLLERARQLERRISMAKRYTAPVKTRWSIEHLKPASPVSRERTLKRGARLLYPHLPATTTTVTYGVQSQQKGELRGRGRPKGTYKSDYKAYGGVYGYRKAMRAARAYARYQSVLQRAAQVQRIQQLQEQQGAPIQQQIQAMRQIPRIPKQVQQMPQQTQQPQGSPYPPVDNRPLAPTRETIPQGYVEAVDAFTGRRFLKPVLPRERWAGGGN